ncbi:hypothetical protein D1BOALGB6SA_8081 [Olavius sp. associated proteobacterium Delta 1]|nr:hypothetical protein D1BOALGB6SA_8081 [Olavius sp. associated proteobacterium Delta 1]
MPNFSLDITTLTILVLLTFAIYLVILVVFIIARRKYKGGVVGQAIQFIIATIGFFLLADMALFLIPISGSQIGYTTHVIFKICAMTCLAVGGLKFFAK